jgi:hypothetical protein
VAEVKHGSERCHRRVITSCITAHGQHGTQVWTRCPGRMHPSRCLLSVMLPELPWHVITSASVPDPTDLRITTSSDMDYTLVPAAQ